MIDIFTVLLPHALMALAVWRLLQRDDLDEDPALPRRKIGWQKPARRPAARSGETGD
ncbi:hypothetical protein OLX02_04225 [Novosphingobium sp. KCTC 2891]|uniref:hypothetical protein n=1 Tax=Novosphingobium sp. KCTC 2891 TaxID=2989730 RepID=UPI002223E7F1|nr:hypothetical protein [Novosphingobium sp. KCTC 2891]MCW1382021.1 hypothetical protein [Novosphingobium sp. KCTC 2891]